MSILLGMAKKKSSPKSKSVKKKKKVVAEKRPKKKAETSAKKSSRKAEKIVIDARKGLVFTSEKELYEYFKKDIEIVEQEYFSLRQAGDFSNKQQDRLEEYLDDTLERPHEIWMDKETLGDGSSTVLHHFIAQYVGIGGKRFWYVVAAYISDEMPRFVFLHFATRHESLVENYRRGELLYDRSQEGVEDAALEGDALSEGDPLGAGLFGAMLKVRNEKDIPIADFKKFSTLREETIENGDEIWRNQDFHGNTLVTFIKEFSEEEAGEEVSYVVITQEDATSSVHALLFSFPTKDKSLLDRYRHGENMQAEEVVQESSH
ncbi:MAG: PBECR2 nuclease fold domain-containing protein [Pseudobdellovibrionaceae bacterium]